ncbi:class I SAM-dependent methyltransferase [uncultured Corynebacterium sp.]|uniref:class I SAM-dependent methyltransferase n=1 Tax=uncultured Corynebacterium sp. TaxID=159447 RepID=UPI0025E8B305|nr:methyltransferase [uncultured Corynebacterium sp.]
MRTLDKLIVDEALIDATATTLICHDPSLDLTRTALDAGGPVVFLDSDYARSQQAAALGARIAGDVRLDEFLAGASGSAVAVGEMPKSLARLDYLARSIAGAGFDDVRVVLGANNKHLSRGMNAVLAESFTDVAASRGRGKFRCLVASGPREVTYTPVRSDGLVAVGGVFSGAKPDRGGELLRSCLPEVPGRLLDLGCGNGSVTRGLEAQATDSDADAVLSARAIGLDATWDDAGSQLSDASFDTIALNPPFHDGTTVDATLVQHLLDAASRLLAPGGSLYLVHNSHLRYRGEVERRFAAVEQVARDKTFTVLRAWN